jgi:dimethylamine/trimethylamine dehydrogenase
LKVKEGRPEDIRECIGCNICVAWNNVSAPSRCTQNPTFGEEWRKGWHPETIRGKASDGHVLIVGAGPAGLEAARAAGRRGYHVTLAEASDELGGRVTKESRLPGLAAWARVRDYRIGQIQQMPNIEVFPASEMNADQVLELGAQHVALATGATWRRDGIGYNIRDAVPGWDRAHVFSPSDLMDGRRPPDGPVLVFDDDGYYMANVLAELLREEGREVMLATPAPLIAQWTQYTLEQEPIEARMVDRGIAMLTRHTLTGVGGAEAELHDDLNRRTVRMDCAGVVMVTARLPNDGLWQALQEKGEAVAAAGVQTIRRIGDCYGAGPIATAVYMGHRYAQELDTEPDPDGVPFLRERHLIEA